MGRNKNEDLILTRIIIQTVKEKKPITVQQLVNLLNNKTSASEQKIIESILQLQTEGKITLERKITSYQNNFSAYLKTNAYWYWITIILCIATVLATFSIPKDSYQIVYIRYILSSIFILYLPGYTFIKALFPKNIPIKTSSEIFNSIERIALSTVMNIILVPFIGLFLNYTTYGIKTISMTLSLIALTLIFSTVAIIREFQKQKH